MCINIKDTCDSVIQADWDKNSDHLREINYSENVYSYNILHYQNNIFIKLLLKLKSKTFFLPYHNCLLCFDMLYVRIITLVLILHQHDSTIQQAVHKHSHYKYKYIVLLPRSSTNSSYPTCVEIREISTKKNLYKYFCNVANLLHL